MNRGVGSSRWLVCTLLGLALVPPLLTAGGCTGPNPDYPEPLSCSIGDRQCKSTKAPASADPAVAQVCGRDSSGELVLIDESCPTGARCDGGRCAPSSSLVACTRQSDCPADKSCVPLVQGSGLATFCVANQPSTTAPGAACTNDRSCQSYHCLQHAQGRYCLLTCGSDNHCPLATPRCQALNVTITGVQGMVGSCSPR